ncbi:hypothetical protein [Demetria terragena]|uniref:hypothetical protein n=1 Tax=Demetria terragena TaxID=63959 RepID=UPI000370241C|nr:hypothetical protein [Demetria terragena]
MHVHRYPQATRHELAPAGDADPMDLSTVTPDLGRQSGVIVIACSQLLDAGAQRHDIDRWLRRKELARVLPSVYANHTGAPTRLQRDWAAVLFAAPAALAWTSAVRAASGQPTRLPGKWGDDGTVHLLVGPGRALVAPPWIVLHRCTRLESAVLWASSPPRQRPEPAAIDVAVAHLRSGAHDAHLQAVAALAEPLQGRRTTAERMLNEIDTRARLAHRRWITEVVKDIATGAASVLEHGYLHRVERAHGLPRALRQVTDTTGPRVAVRDALYPDRRAIELDGRAFHQGADRRDHDLERDLDASLAGLASTRIGWAQVFDRPCLTAGKISALLAADGWGGEPTECRPGCRAPAVFRRTRAA